MVDLGKLSSPGPLPSLKLFTTSKSSFILTESKFCREDDETSVRYTLKDNGMILLARFGPTLAKTLAEPICHVFRISNGHTVFLYQ